jgi:hypothetical protein
MASPDAFQSYLNDTVTELNQVMTEAEHLLRYGGPISLAESHRFTHVRQLSRHSVCIALVEARSLRERLLKAAVATFH